MMRGKDTHPVLPPCHITLKVVLELGQRQRIKKELKI